MAMANRAADVTDAGGAEGGVVGGAVGEATTGNPKTAKLAALGEIIGIPPLYIPIAPFCVFANADPDKSVSGIANIPPSVTKSKRTVPPNAARSLMTRWTATAT